MIAFIKSSLGTMVFLLVLSLFFSAPIVYSLISGIHSVVFVTPILVAFYMALLTVKSKTWKSKLWFNSVFWVSLGPWIALLLYHVVPVYFPEYTAYISTDPAIFLDLALGTLGIYLASILLFINMFHVGRESMRQAATKAESHD